jgi:hypothetical protein
MGIKTTQNFTLISKPLRKMRKICTYRVGWGCRGGGFEGKGREGARGQGGYGRRGERCGSLIPIPGICITPSCLEREKSSYRNISHFFYFPQEQREDGGGGVGTESTNIKQDKREEEEKLGDE